MVSTPIRNLPGIADLDLTHLLLGLLTFGGDTRSLTDGQSRHVWSPHRSSPALPNTITHTIDGALKLLVNCPQ